ncbi:hypothetical protein RvY_06613 [Ramazzottius varieornatus]|uniref:Protein Wnt n=1 Tax=Ramazzottius varieornatus TaxID=947166 RepID=A0A1D1UZ78_RAMVA|nr:hypothetical protein RvY_06613 [Ramazzottius varieornatus]
MSSCSELMRFHKHVGLAASSVVNAPLHHVSENSVNNWREVRTASEIKQSLPNLDWCQRIPGLVEHQLALCRRSPDVFRKVTGAAQLAIHECQEQFRGERWNCTTVNDSTVFGRTAVKGNKETAFIAAISSAAVVHAVVRACSAGNLTECGCDTRQDGQHAAGGQWKWSGCSDHVEYGMEFSRQFNDAPEEIKRRDARSIRDAMHLHNKAAGRMIVQKHMRLQCRCHGVSGSCQVKTCWSVMPKFSFVGRVLKKRYDRAVWIAKRSIVKLKRRGLSQGKERKKPIRGDELVYLEKSPNYCKANKKRGIIGTSGRRCNSTSAGADNCEELCCGRGHYSRACYNEPTDPQYGDPETPYSSGRARSVPRQNRAPLDFFGSLMSNNRSTPPRSRSRTSQPQDDYPPYPGDYGPALAPVFGFGFGPAQAGWGRKNERVVYLAIPLTALSALLASGQLSNLGLGTAYPASSPLPPLLPISGGYDGGGSSYAGGTTYGSSASYGGASGGYVSGLTTGSNYGPSHFVPYGSNGGGPSLNSVLFGGTGAAAAGGSYGSGSSYGGGSTYGSGGSYGGGDSYRNGGDSYSNNFDGDSYNGGSGGGSSYGGGSGSYSGSGYSGSNGGGKYGSGGFSKGDGNYGGTIDVNIPLPPPIRPLGVIGGGGSGLPCLRGPGTVYSTQVWVCVWPYQAEAGSCYVGDSGLVPNLPVPFPPPVPPPILPIIGGGISGGYGGTYDDEKPSLRGKSMDDDDGMPPRSLTDTVVLTTTTPNSSSSLLQPVSGKPRCLSVVWYLRSFSHGVVK